MTPTRHQWEAYRLTHPDHEGLSYEEAAEVMGVSEIEVANMLGAMRFHHPDLFTDISGDGRRPDHGVSRYGGWAEGQIKQKF